MYKRARIIMLLLLGSGTNLFSQQLSNQVLVPVAGVTSAGTYDFSQTIGETAVEIIGCTDYTFTQGFQQPCVKFSKENKPAGNGVKVYPNPAADFISVELFGNDSRTFRIDIINISGTIVSTEKVEFTGSYWLIKPLSVGQISNGLFFVRIISDDGLFNRTFKISKM